MRRGKKWIRKVLVKWKGFAEPNWEDRSSLKENEGLVSGLVNYSLNELFP